jgi:hypothetical protein
VVGRPARDAGKGTALSGNIEQINLIEFSAPLIAGGYFTVKLIIDINIKNIGRKRVEELCIYQIIDGKVVFEQFFRDK